MLVATPEASRALMSPGGTAATRATSRTLKTSGGSDLLKDMAGDELPRGKILAVQPDRPLKDFDRSWKDL
jgi:hypothetical protein